MKPTTEVAGVLFDEKEVPIVVEELGKYVADSRVFRSEDAERLYRSISPIATPKYGQCAGVFLPDHVAVELGKEMQQMPLIVETRSPAQKINPLIGALGLVGFGMAGLAHTGHPNYDERALWRSEFGRRMEQTATQSREKYSKRQNR